MTLLDSLLALVIFFIIILSQMGRGGRRGVVKRFRCRFLSSRFISFLHPLVFYYHSSLLSFLMVILCYHATFLFPFTFALLLSFIFIIPLHSSLLKIPLDPRHPIMFILPPSSLPLPPHHTIIPSCYLLLFPLVINTPSSLPLF